MRSSREGLATVAFVTKRQPAETPALANPKWTWHYRTLLRLRERLLRERNQNLADATEPIGAQVRDAADRATDELEHDMAWREAHAEEDTLEEVEEALERLRTNTYGLCQLTGKPIAAGRLKARPWARYGKAAALQVEQWKRTL
jgi:DnaK suppressor protein